MKLGRPLVEDALSTIVIGIGILLVAARTFALLCDLFYHSIEINY